MVNFDLWESTENAKNRMTKMNIGFLILEQIKSIFSKILKITGLTKKKQTLILHWRSSF